VGSGISTRPQNKVPRSLWGEVSGFAKGGYVPSALEAEPIAETTFHAVIGYGLVTVIPKKKLTVRNVRMAPRNVQRRVVDKTPQRRRHRLMVKLRDNYLIAWTPWDEGRGDAPTWNGPRVGSYVAEREFAGEDESKKSANACLERRIAAYVSKIVGRSNALLAIVI